MSDLGRPARAAADVGRNFLLAAVIPALAAGSAYLGGGGWTVVSVPFATAAGVLVSVSMLAFWVSAQRGREARLAAQAMAEAEAAAAPAVVSVPAPAAAEPVPAAPPAAPEPVPEPAPAAVAPQPVAPAPAGQAQAAPRVPVRDVRRTGTAARRTTNRFFKPAGGGGADGGG